ncbi:hypothetical protein LTR53_002582 [Teratosphaeriaceae sp. CCFEE 6253]|nr:hypothetical protein LTR53_002582 [Teratosphaeriaceae sp. CCFEE 6253]
MSYYQDPNQRYQQGEIVCGMGILMLNITKPIRLSKPTSSRATANNPTTRLKDTPHYGQQQQQQHQPSQPGQGQHAAPEVSDAGTYQGVAYNIKHRNAFSIPES